MASGDGAQALLALAGAGAEAGVALDLLEVGVAEAHRVLDVGERDVLAAAEDDLARHAAYFAPAGVAGGSNIFSSSGSSNVIRELAIHRS